MNTNGNSTYTADNIKVLEGLEAVRLRPAMYIGNIDVAGLHHLVYEVVDNSIDEAMAGVCDLINVMVHTDNSVTVTDNGRGIPVGMHKKENKPALEVVMTKLHAGGKFDSDSYKVSGGLHGVGVSVVNALSVLLEVEVYTDGNIYHQTYSRGQKTSELEVIGKTRKRGTKVHFLADPEIFTVTEFSNDILIRRLRELAFLNKGVRITYEDERSDVKEEFFYKGGIIAFCEHLNRRNTSPAQGDLHRWRKERHTGRGRHPVQRHLLRQDPVLRQQHQYHRGRDTPHRVQVGVDPHHQPIRHQQQRSQEHAGQDQRR